jgi:hypothetical protein
MTFSAPSISFGAFGVHAFGDDLEEVFKTLEKHNVKELDTANIYVSHMLPLPSSK